MQHKTYAWCPGHATRIAQMLTLQTIDLDVNPWYFAESPRGASFETDAAMTTWDVTDVELSEPTPSLPSLYCTETLCLEDFLN